MTGGDRGERDSAAHTTSAPQTPAARVVEDWARHLSTPTPTSEGRGARHPGSAVVVARVVTPDGVLHQVLENGGTTGRASRWWLVGYQVGRRRGPTLWTGERARAVGWCALIAGMYGGVRAARMEDDSGGGAGAGAASATPATTQDDDRKGATSK